MEFKEKISKLMAIDEMTLKRMTNAINLIHSDDLYEEVQRKDNYYEIPIFEGKIMIKREDDQLSYKFIPGDTFQGVVKDTLLNGISFEILNDGFMKSNDYYSIIISYISNKI